VPQAAQSRRSSSILLEVIRFANNDSNLNRLITDDPRGLAGIMAAGNLL
jgi:hypothetical protein